jgi:hypothetical protein
MEERVRDPNTWAGMLGMVLGGDLYVDMVDDEAWDTGMVLVL